MTRVRIVPGGSSIRDGCFIGRGVTCMPPMFINVGAYVGNNTMVDSHALVGSCAQIGENCHISAAAQIGGVLEPVGAMPVIIENHVMVGGNCGVYEGTIVKERAVLGSGVILTRSTPVYDVVRGEVLTATDDDPLVIPEGAVVVAGSRADQQRSRAGVGDFAVHSGDCEVSRFKDGRAGAARRLAALDRQSRRGWQALTQRSPFAPSRSRKRGSSRRPVWMLPMAESSVSLRCGCSFSSSPNISRKVRRTVPVRWEQPHGITGAPSDAA